PPAPAPRVQPAPPAATAHGGPPAPPPPPPESGQGRRDVEAAARLEIGGAPSPVKLARPRRVLLEAIRLGAVRDPQAVRGARGVRELGLRIRPQHSRHEEARAHRVLEGEAPLLPRTQHGDVTPGTR